MGIGAAALLEKHWRPPISGNKTKKDGGRTTQ